MRLRDLELRVGHLPTGRVNAVTDVPGVRVGHAPGAVGGVTVVLPYAAAPRRSFVGRWSLDGGDELTGLNMTEDFGALSAPLLLAPAPAVGRVYDGLLDYGFGISAGLGEDDAWPPVVLALDGVPAPAAALHTSLGPAQVAAALSTAAVGAPAEGQVGIGRGLRAFGVRAGVGTASRQVAVPEAGGGAIAAADTRGSGGPHTVGVLLAANGGEPERLSVDGSPVGHWLAGLKPLPPTQRRTFAALVITDAPLIPRQLQRLAERAAFGLVRVGLVDEATHAGVVLALSTTGLDDAVAGVGPATVMAARTAEAGLPMLFAAAAEACEEAVLNALVAAAHGSGPDDGPVLPTDALRAALRR